MYNNKVSICVKDGTFKYMSINLFFQVEYGKKYYYHISGDYCNIQHDYDLNQYYPISIAQWREHFLDVSDYRNNILEKLINE